MARADSAFRVLVVDDEAVVRTAIRRILDKPGLDVKLAESGEQALESMAEQPAALVLLDMKMPGMDGLEVLKVLRSNFPATMVIMITGYPTLENAIECLKLGAMDYLVKPFRVDELETLLQKALETINQQESGGVGGGGTGRAGGFHHWQERGHGKGVYQNPAGRSQ